MSEASKEEMEHQVTTMIEIYNKALKYSEDNVATHQTPPDIPAYLMACHGIAEYLEINEFSPESLKDLENAFSGIINRYLNSNLTEIPIDPSLN
tara:strand:+ start:1053 stop:1334 length:282 start_codon:yes stop_codon:yes gene_type:complete